MLSVVGDLRYLIINDSHDLPTVFNFDKLNKIWESIQEQVHEKCGMSDETQIILQKQRDMAILYCEVVGNNKKDLLPVYNKAKKEYELYTKSVEVSKFDWFDHIADLEEALGYQINLKYTPVSLYLSYVEKVKRKHGRKSD
jgi:hypothetical protein